MTRLFLLAGWIVGGCGEPQLSMIDALSDRATVEAVVSDCDRGAGRPDCDRARQILADARREDRLATYHQAF